MRSGLSSFSFLGLAIAATLMLLFGRETLPGAIAAGVGVGLMVLFIALEFRAAKPVQMWTSAGLLAVGLLLIVVASSGSLEGLGLIYKGLVQNLQYLLLFASIVWLQVQATQSPSLLELRERPIGTLSGGQRKRAFLARAIAQRASVLLLDEPFNGVDVRTEKLMADLFLQFRDEGRTILISTHDLSHVREFCDLVVLINKTVLAYGETSEVFTPENLALTFGGLPPNLLTGPSSSEEGQP